MDFSILSQSSKGVNSRLRKQFRLGSSNNRADNLSKTFWSVQTNVRRFTLLRYLQMKATLGMATDIEYRLLLDWRGVLESDLFVDALRARNIGIDPELLFRRIAAVQKMEGLEPWSINLYYTLDGVISYHIEEVRMTIRKVKKFSGYVRNSSSVGTKSSRKVFTPYPESFEWFEDVKKDYYSFFSVGEWSSGASGNFVLTLTMDQSPKRNENIKTRKG